MVFGAFKEIISAFGLKIKEIMIMKSILMHFPLY